MMANISRTANVRGGGVRLLPLVSTHVGGATLLYVLVLVVNCSDCTLVMVHSSTGPPVSRGSPRSVFALNDCLDHSRCNSAPLLCNRTCASRITLRTSNGVYGPIAGRKTPICRHGRGTSTSRGSSCFMMDRGGGCMCTRGVLFPHVRDSTRTRTCRS